ncbi:MAG: FkbM family methyltransferase [Bacteroidales bacterium]|nr:FkbM family methyltransferase [Bacteroidales bacterium]
MIRYFEYWLVKKTQWKEYNSSICKLAPNYYQYSKNTYRKVNRNGINYLLDISDIVDYYVYWGFREKAHEKMYSICNIDDIILDVGTNIGSVLMNLAKIAKNGQVHGFEPSNVNYQKAIYNLKLNNFSNIKLNNLALGKSDDFGHISIIDEHNLGKNKIINIKNHNDYKNTEKIKIISIDKYYKELKLEKIDVIKIDTEGYEYNVLQGASYVLNKFHPKLLVEIDDTNLKEQNSSPIEILKFLWNFGYKCYNTENDTIVNETFNFKNCHFDILAIIN